MHLVASSVKVLTLEWQELGDTVRKVYTCVEDAAQLKT